MDTETALGIFEGTMIGDAGLAMHGRNARLGISLSEGEPAELISYLTSLKWALLAMHVLPLQNYPKVFKAVSHGKPYNYCRLQSRTSPVLTAEYYRWYPEGQKVIPLNLRLTPVSLARWYMDDGCSSIDHRNTDIDVTLSTYRFEVKDIAILENNLYRLGISTGRKHDAKVKTGDGIIMAIRQGSVNDFMHMIDPFVVEPYRYKIKYRS